VEVDDEAMAKAAVKHQGLALRTDLLFNGTRQTQLVFSNTQAPCGLCNHTMYLPETIPL
jgi:hypothetical protein